MPPDCLDTRTLPAASPAAAPASLLEGPGTDLDAILEAAAARGDVRLLRKLRLPCRYADPEPGERVHHGLVVDCETLGLDSTDPMIEIAVLPFEFTVRGRVVGVGQTQMWREDPGRPVPPEITNLTGISDDDVKGRAFPDAEIAALFERASLVIAHNAGFDRPRIESRFRTMPRRIWACSVLDVDWKQRGLGSSKLDYVSAFYGGVFYEAHRATADVEALLHVLAIYPPDGRTPAIHELIRNAAMPSWMVVAHGAPFEAKELLKRRQYKWDPDARHWWRYVHAKDKAAEEEWLNAEVYAGLMARPHIIEIGNTDRFL